MKKENWMVIYQRKGEDSPRQFFSVPVTKRLAKDLFDVFDDAKYLVKIKKVKNEIKFNK